MACCIAAAFVYGLILRGLAALRIGPLARGRPEPAWPPAATWPAPGAEAGGSPHRADRQPSAHG